MRPSHGSPRIPASGQATPESRNPNGVLAPVTAHRQSAAPAIRQRMSIQSASRIRVVAANSMQSPAQVEGERVAPPARRQHDATGAEEDEERAEPEVAEGHHDAPEQADPEGAEQQREPCRDAALRPEVAEDPVEQRRCRDRHLAGGAGRCRCGAERARSASVSSWRWAARSVGAGREVDPHPGALRAPSVDDQLDGPAVQVGHPAAMARPRPVPPPPSFAASVPNGSNTRSRSAGETPGPWSCTSSRQVCSVRVAVMETVPPDGL